MRIRGLCDTKSKTLLSTTGSALRWRCAAGRSPISRCATRVLTCLTRDTICNEVVHCQTSFLFPPPGWGRLGGGEVLRESPSPNPSHRGRGSFEIYLTM